MLEIKFDNAQYARLERLFRDGTPLFHKSVIAALRRSGGNMRKNIRKGMKAVSYLKGADLSRYIGALAINAGDHTAIVLVKGPKLGAHRFKLKPNSITAKKGQRSVSWPSPGVQLGPGEPELHLKWKGYSRPFIADTGKLRAMYMRERGTGKLKVAGTAAPQYFAAFDKVSEPVMAEAEKVFLKRLEHEIDYRLGLK